MSNEPGFTTAALDAVAELVEHSRSAAAGRGIELAGPELVLGPADTIELKVTALERGQICDVLEVVLSRAGVAELTIAELTDWFLTQIQTIGP